MTSVNPVRHSPKRAQPVGSTTTTPTTYIKHGRSNQVQREVDAMHFIRQHTSIPIPSVIEVHVDESDTERSWFTMTVIPGSCLTDAWPNMQEEAREAAQTELRFFLQEMRAIPPPTPVHIGSCTGGPAYDHRLNNGWPCGPFASESDFNDFLVAPVARCPKKELVKHYRQQLSDNHGVVFTHADLGGDHIFVDTETGKITGIID